MRETVDFGERAQAAHAPDRTLVLFVHEVNDVPAGKERRHRVVRSRGVQELELPDVLLLSPDELVCAARRPECRTVQYVLVQVLVRTSTLLCTN